MKVIIGLFLVGAFCTSTRLADANMAWVAVSGDGGGFVLAELGRVFAPWGFNYDHDGAGRLIEDYWEREWATVEEDFREMKELGANVVRVHLQFGKFMDAPDQPNAVALKTSAKATSVRVPQTPCLLSAPTDWRQTRFPR